MASMHCPTTRGRGIGSDKSTRTRPARAVDRGFLVGEIARYLGALSLVVVGIIHAQQYYYDYFNVVPTIGTLFLLSFVGAGVVGAMLIIPVRRLGRNIGDLILVLAALGGIGIAIRSARSPHDQRIHTALRVHGVRLSTRSRAHTHLR